MIRSRNRIGSRALVALAGALLGATALSGCALGGSIDDFIENPGPPVQRPAGDDKVDGGRIFKDTASSVVTVIVDYDGDGLAEGLGTGFAVGPKTIVTNVHVIGDLFHRRKADDVFVQTRDGSRYPAFIKGTDSHADVAVLSVDYEDLKVAKEFEDALGLEQTDSGVEAPRLKPLKFGASRALAVGDQVVAIGASLGITDSMAVGYVTGLDRRLRGLAGFTIPGAIQTDAAITLGNSGGPLLNTRGEVVGINDQIATVGGGGEGLGFAIPSDVVENSLNKIEQVGKVEYPYLGARTRPVPRTLTSALDLPMEPGVLVFSTRDDSPARAAGLRGSEEMVQLGGSEWPEGADFITAVDGRALRPNETMTTALARFEPGDRITLTVQRKEPGYSDSKPVEIPVTLAKRPLLWDE
jgi:S1-C subfamily serine protease